MHTAPGSERGMWVWNTGDVIGTESKLQTFISTIKAAGVSDAYLYLRSADYASQDAHLEHALTELHNAGIKAWGLEGWRGYFADADGPSGLYAAADQLVAFNTRHATGAQFAGFVSDMEPQDGQGPTFPNHFHNGLADSQLSAAQAADREMLMEDWVRIQTTLDDKMHAAHLQYAATMPSWTDDYYGQPVNVTVNGVREGVMQAIMGHVDQYLAMTYNTDPTNAANRALGEVSYADTLGPNHPLVFAAVETNSGVGRGVSYGDDAVKDTRAAVLADMQAIHDQLASHPSFGGVNIHDWTGWWNLHP
jgi:hypothetical protein